MSFRKCICCYLGGIIPFSYFFCVSISKVIKGDSFYIHKYKLKFENFYNGDKEYEFVVRCIIAFTKLKFV